MNLKDYNTELYHYGVKGMKWGVRRAEKKYAKKLAKSGIMSGRADYERDQAASEYKKYNSDANRYSRAAKSYEKRGKTARAFAADKRAASLRSKATDAKEIHEAWADDFDERAKKLRNKAETYASKKNVKAGRSVVDRILKNAKAKGYESEAQNDERAAEELKRERIDKAKDTVQKIFDLARPEDK